MHGIYRFYLNDELVYEQENALTVAGRSIILKSLLGIIPNFANAISYGIGTEANVKSQSSNLITNNTMEFEIGKTKVVGNSLLIENNNDILVYSAIISDPLQFEIREVGLYPSALADATVGVDGSVIFNFDNVDVFTKFGTASGAALVSTENARIGTQLFSLPQTSSANNYLQYSATDGSLEFINRYTSQDIFKLAGYNSTTASTDVYFRFMKDDSNYFDVKFTTPTASGYFISKVEKGAATTTGTLLWSDINFVKMWQESSTPVFLDAMRIDIGNYFIDTNYGLISRAVLPSPIRKPLSIPLTIEYSLSLGFNYGVS